MIATAITASHNPSSEKERSRMRIIDQWNDVFHIEARHHDGSLTTYAAETYAEARKLAAEARRSKSVKAVSMWRCVTTTYGMGDPARDTVWA